VVEGATTATEIRMRSTILASKRARVLRRAMTKPEVWLWGMLRQRVHGAPIFRRQHPLGYYILDFYCPSARLCVEIDGSTHWTESQAAHDRRRDAWLRSQEIEVVRIPATDVLKHLDTVALGIRALAAERAAAAAPSTTLRAVPLPRDAGKDW
jgi:very-short-patch-repair endonuclease